MTAVVKWLLSLVVAIAAIKFPWYLLKFNSLSQTTHRWAQSQPYYFYNEVTGAVQWVDPGDTPYEDETGQRYWLDANNQRQFFPPAGRQYVWIEQWSDELKKPFFYNQETHESQWERPADLAWRRVRVQQW